MRRTVHFDRGLSISSLDTTSAFRRAAPGVLGWLLRAFVTGPNGLVSPLWERITHAETTRHLTARMPRTQGGLLRRSRQGHSPYHRALSVGTSNKDKLQLSPKGKA